ncbi:hypothetical protein T492DRAFT_1149557 [Pavlovales sp. CCMP2436]|nr:hypothetical protein T492DRAFT_1149557 [Pavlovales sp. CCMP2436]
MAAQCVPVLRGGVLLALVHFSKHSGRQGFIKHVAQLLFSGLITKEDYLALCDHDTLAILSVQRTIVEQVAAMRQEQALQIPLRRSHEGSPGIWGFVRSYGDFGFAGRASPGGLRQEGFSRRSCAEYEPRDDGRNRGLSFSPLRRRQACSAGAESRARNLHTTRTAIKIPLHRSGIRKGRAQPQCLPHAPLHRAVVVCPEVFYSQQKMREHLREHDPEKPYACDVVGCGTRWAAPCNFEEHTRTHTGERPYLCDELGCKHSATTVGSLTTHSARTARHNLTHSGERPFPCDEPGCGYSSTTGSNLKTHKRMHRRDLRPAQRGPAQHGALSCELGSRQGRHGRRGRAAGGWVGWHTFKASVALRLIISAEARVPAAELAEELRAVARERGGEGAAAAITHDAAFSGGAVPIGAREVIHDARHELGLPPYIAPAASLAAMVRALRDQSAS